MDTTAPRVQAMPGAHPCDSNPAPADPVAIRPGLVLRNRFTLGRRIASGGIGALYQAIDRRRIEADYPDPFVAIKVLSGNFHRRTGATRILQYEAILAQRLVHPNLVRVFDFDRHAGVYFLTMEWLHGESLARRINRTPGRPLRWGPARRILGDVMSGLHFAHDNGVIHGDVKPANVFLTTEGQVKLVDFGLACTVRTGRTDSRTGPVVLTPAYASCEVHEGRRPTVQDDVFALAVMAYQMLAGFHPFGNQAVIDARRLGVEPIRPPGLSAAQWRTLRRGLAFRREHRLMSVMELAHGLLGERNKRLMKPWPLSVRVASILYAAGLALWYAGPNQVGGPGVEADSIVPYEAEFYRTPPISEQGRRPGFKILPAEEIIALKPVSRQDAIVESDGSSAWET